MFHVYTKPQCTFCDQAKALLKLKELPYREFILDVGQPKDDGKQYVSRDEVLATFPGARTMPQILVTVDGATTIIGGFTELKGYVRD